MQRYRSIIRFPVDLLCTNIKKNMASPKLCVLLFAVLITVSAAIKMFDKGDCDVSPEAKEIAKECAEPYENNLAEMTDDIYNKMTPKQQEDVRGDLANMAKCCLEKVGAIDDNDVLQKDVIIQNYEGFILEPPCRKEALMKKVKKCLANYKTKDQNNGVGFCLGFNQQSICDKDYRSPDPNCKYP